LCVNVVSADKLYDSRFKIQSIINVDVEDFKSLYSKNFADVIKRDVLKDLIDIIEHYQSVLMRIDNGEVYAVDC